MDILIQNLSEAPIFFQRNKMENGKPTPLPRIIFEGGKQITKVSEEVYQLMLKSPFYKQKFEQGLLVPLNGSNAEQGIKESIQANEILYAKYVGLVTRIKSTVGTEADALKPYLDETGMPNFDLCKKNLGNGFEMQNLPQFRQRYLIEVASGMHGGVIILPNGGSLQAGSEDVKTEVETVEEQIEAPASESLESKTIEELKMVADELGVEYDEDITFKRLLNRVKKAQDAVSNIE